MFTKYLIHKGYKTNIIISEHIHHSKGLSIEGSIRMKDQTSLLIRVLIQSVFPY